ncbi:MAG: sugar isomerase [Clostridia bacterium]|nr:sugar isomerase [Clostridia bacterium]
MGQKDGRIKKNVISGFLYQIILIALGFILPRLYLENFGSEVNGVLSTIKQIFTYMCLLEAGVGLASTQALYKPIAEKDYKGASSILAATSSYYFKTGIIYTAIVLVIACVYSFVIPTSINSFVLFTVIILNALPALFSYFVQAKYRVLMEVDGRKYVITNSEIVLQIASNVGKILVLLLTDSLVLIQLVYCVIALVQLAYLYFYAKKRYTWLNFKEKPDFKAIAQKDSVLVHQISGMVFNNTDVLLLSAMCDFKVVSVYTIYNMFFSQMQAFITSIVSGFSFALGQMFQVDREKFNRVYSAYETLYIMATFIIYTLMATFLLPLIQIYTDGINDANYTNALLIFLFVVMNLLSNGKLPSNYVLEFSGKFKETRSHAIIEMAINLVVSVFAILKWGICGAIFGTIMALLFRGPMMIYYANKKVLEKSVFSTYKHWLINGGVFAFVMIILSVDSFSGLSFFKLLINGVIHSIWIVALYIGVNFIFNRQAFKTIIEYFRGKKRS